MTTLLPAPNSQLLTPSPPMKFLLRTPFLRLLLAVVAGIGVHEVLHVPGWVVWTAGGLSVGLVVVSRCIRAVDLRYRYRWLFGCGVGLFFMVLSYALCAWQEQRQAFDHVGEPGIFEVEVERLPVEKARSYLVEVRVRRFADSLAVRASRGRGYVYLEKDSAVLALAPGDRLLLEACFAPPASLNNPGGFDYARYLRRKGIGATAYVPGDSWRMAGRAEGFTIMGLAQQCQRRLVDVFRRFDFSSENFGVLAALSFGYVDELDPDLREQYNVTGITHILAVSGMHVGIIYFLLDFLLRFLDRSRPLRRVKAVVILLLIWSYAFITGLPPSAFRATLMFSLVAVGRMFGGRSSVYNTLSMSAFFMLLVNPNLLFHVGFQLSYAAVVGIVYLQPRLYRLLSPRNRPAKWLWSLLTVSVAAQVGTMPLTLYYFQTLAHEGKISSDIPIYIDSPMANKATQIVLGNPQEFDDEARKIYEMQGKHLLSMKQLHFTATAQESRMINETPGTKIILSASGMCDAGRILHHLKHNLWREDSSVIIAGYQAEGCLGRKLIEGVRQVKIMGESPVIRRKAALAAS